MQEDLLSVLSIGNTQKALEENSPAVPVPWAFVKEPIFDFANFLREHGIFFSQASNHAANILQPLLQSGKTCEFSVPGGKVLLLNCPTAKNLIDSKGKTRLLSWDSVKGYVNSFLDHLYVYNIFIVEAKEQAINLIQEKTRDKNLFLRIKQTPEEAV